MADKNMTESSDKPRDQNEPIIEASELSFSYGSGRVFSDIAFTIRRGDFAGLIGANGAGKSTLIRLVLGQLQPTTGSLRLFGCPQRQFNDWRRMGYVPQKANAFNTDFPITVEELVALPFYPHGHRLGQREKINQAVARALTIVKMRDFAGRRIGALSGGQQQRVFIAKALVNQPELLLLDEPTVGVDLQAEAEIYDLLQHLNRVHGLTIFWVSHDIAAVSSHTNRLLCLGCDGFFEHDYHQSDDEILTRLYGRSMRPHTHRHSGDNNRSPDSDLNLNQVCGLDHHHLESEPRRVGVAGDGAEEAAGDANSKMNVGKKED